MATKLIDNVRATGSTVGALTTDFVTYAIPDLTTVGFNAYAVLYESSTPTSSIITLVGSVVRSGAGPVITAQGQVPVGGAAIAAATLTLVVAGNTIIVRGTGVAVLTVVWCCNITPFVYTPV